MNIARSPLFIFAALFLLIQLSSLYAASREDIASALELARRDLRISIAMEERITSELTKLHNSGTASEGIIKDYEYYLSLVKAMVAEHRRVVAEMEALSAMFDVRKASERTAHRDDTEAMVNPPIAEEQVVDEVTLLDRQLDSSLAEFDEMLLKELDLILAKSSDKMRDLSEEAEAAAQRLRDRGIEIDTDIEEESTESGEGSRAEQKEVAKGQESTESEEGSRAEQKRAVKGEGTRATGRETQSEQGKNDAELKARDIFRKGAESSKSHPRNRYDPRDDDIVARQLREAAEEETDPVLREKLWREYEQYKKNTGT